MLRDLLYYAEEFGFIPNGISLNILEQRKEIVRFLFWKRTSCLVTLTQDKLVFGKLMEGKSFVRRKRKVLISVAQTSRKEGFRQRFLKSRIDGAMADWVWGRQRLRKMIQKFLIWLFHWSPLFLLGHFPFRISGCEVMSVFSLNFGNFSQCPVSVC